MSAATEEHESESTLDDDWVRDLEVALSDGCEFSKVREIAQNRPFPVDKTRAKAWAVLLGVSNRGDPFLEWDQLYDLSDQAKIRQECQKIVGSFGNPEADRIALVSDLESVLTLYCKTRKVEFDADIGWSDILQLLLVLEMPKSQLYNVFYAFTTKYIPQGCVADGKPFDLFRLLLLYHDPGLCSFLDTRKIKPDMYAKQWFNCLFASIADLDVGLRILDVYLQLADPFLVFFMALVMLINAKEQIVEMANESREKIAETISGFPKQLAAADIEDFCQLAAYYSSRTPQSFRRDYHGPLFGSNLADEFESVTVHSLLCLPVSVQELLLSNQIIDSENVHYFVVDGRPMSQYANGHLPGAFNLDCSLLVNSPAEFHLAVQSLGAFKAKTHPDDHICFIGSGRDQEDQYVHMVVASFLQKRHQYVSLARGGYAALHEVLREGLSTRLKSHNAKHCIQCNRPSTAVSQSPSPKKYSIGEEQASIISRVSAAVRDRSSKMKDRVYEYVTNPQSAGNDEVVRHVDSSDRHGRRYRNQPSVFSIADDSDASSDEFGVNDEGSTTSRHREKVKLSTYFKQPDITAQFEGHQLESGKQYMHPCHLALTRTHLHVLHDCPDEKGFAFVHLRRPLANVHKMTSKKRLPELLTIKYGYELTPGQHKNTGVDKFLVPKAGDCAKAIKAAIFVLHEPIIQSSFPQK